MTKLQSASSFLVVTLIAVAGLGPQAPRARAATYDVSACNAASGTNNSWSSSSNNSTATHVSQRCPTGSSTDGLATAAYTYSANHVGVNTRASWEFDAPAGTTITHIDSQGRFQVADNALGAWHAGLQTGGGRYVLGCNDYNAVHTSSYCTGAAAASLSVDHATVLRSTIVCAASSGCALSGHGNTTPDAEARLYYADVTVEDDTKPTLTNGRGNWWTSPGWIRGTQALGFDASDNSGISAFAATIDGTLLFSDDHSGSCDYTRPAPCPASSGTNQSLSTTSFSDGPHTLTLYANDATASLSNLSGVSRTVYIDNNAPGAVNGLNVVGGQGWRSSNGYTLTWTNPDQGSASPIAAAHYEYCDSNGNNGLPPFRWTRVD